LIGTSRADVLTGTAGDDFIDGRGSFDTMTGLGGNDTYVVDNSRDSVVEQVGGGIDTVQSSVSHTLAANVENLVLTGTGSINGTGNGLDNVITGNAGSNTLSGGLGDDHLYGGAGSDRLNGGDGNDVLDGGTGGDTMNGGLGNDIYIVDNGGDQISDTGGVDAVWTSRAQYTLGGGIEDLVYTGTANFTGTGNSAANSITGGSGSDTLNGGGGNDVLDGGAGIDFLRGGSGSDTFVFHAGSAAGDRVSDFSGAGSTIGDMLMFEGFGAGTITQVGATDHYILTSDLAHGGISEEIVLTGVMHLDLGVGSNDFLFV
jgi:Ca2+-binding RTX toxin-like protein